MRNLLLTLNIIISIVVVFLILIQGKGAGLGSAWGASGELYQTKRGVEKLTTRLTIFFILIFFIISIISLFVK